MNISRMAIFLRELRKKSLLVNYRLILKKPLFIMRALYRAIRQEFFKTDAVRGVLFATHYKCNLNCQHCYEKKFNNTKEKLMTLDEKKKAIKDCLSAGALAFDFVGGETSLDKNLPELIKECRPYRTYITLATNGYILDEDKIKELWSMGVDKLNISIDGWDSKSHDEFRRKEDSHKKALSAVDICRKVGMDVSICMVVYKDYTKDDSFQKMVDYCIENRIKLAFIAAIPLGNWEGRTDLLISDEDKKIMKDLNKKHPFITRDNWGTRYGGCPAFNEIITITAYGDVMPCDFLHISFGNIKRESLKDIVKKGRSISYFDGTFDGCLAAESVEFIENCLSKTYKATPYPPDSKDVFDSK